MRSFFSRTPDLEGGHAYKKGFTGDHRGRSHIPPNPSPLFSPQSQFNPFSAPSAVYRHDTIFKPAPSPSPKSVVFSERSWSASGRQGTGAAAALYKGQLDRLHEYLGVLPSGNIPQRDRRGFSVSEPSEDPVNVSPSIPLSPQVRMKGNLKQKAVEEQFRKNNRRSFSRYSHDALLGEETQGRGGKWKARKKSGDLGEGVGRDGEETGYAEEGASEGMREGGFVGPFSVGTEEELWPKDLGEFLEKYDPRAEDLPDVYPMGEHRAMLRTMNAKYKDLRVPERWDQIQEDLEKYTRSIRNYEYWLTSSMPTLDLSKSSFPPRFHLYGKQLAILEVAKHYSHSSESCFTNELERKLVAYHTDWSVSNGVWRGLRWETRSKGWKSGSAGAKLFWRLLGAVLGGVCVLAPVCILVLWPEGVSREGGVGVVGVSVVVVGVFLSWETDSGSEKRGWDAIEGAGERERERKFFGGEWGGRDIMVLLAAYAAVLVVFLGVAVV
ncbi:hypothetical protein EYC80_003360 [Monilinia laxa]|uniref:Uncharacterized protein n=1 Tax=Monilinia laxa TaxID=61186 RepID=A0A5N6KDG6_MONLA|nr:hypothetical protein EYC80_003360 [Monilinia laxa]